MVASSPFCKGDEHALVVIAQTCGAISFIASLYIIISYIRFPKLRRFSSKLVLLIALCDLGCDISYFIGSPADGSHACTFQGVIQQFFQLAVVLWVAAISYTLYYAASRQRLLKDEQQALLTRFHLVIWSVAIILTALVATTKSYGQTGAWCWIR